MKYNFYRFREIYDRLIQIMKDHSDEINEFGDNSKLDLWEESYLAASDAGCCWVLIAEKEDKIVGYLLFFINQNLHRKNLQEVNEEAFYIYKDHRGIGSVMMQKFEEFVKNKGIKRITFGVPTGRMKPMFKRKGYKPTYEIYVKEL